ncbi:DUF368 domain-containing protein [Aurantivibrio infirmus]
MLANKFRKTILLFLKGMAMGAADSVPGVSGGTIALISGIYQEFLDSLRNINFVALGLLFKSGPKAAWAHINGNFLLTLFGGILFSIVSFSKLILYCLDHYPILVWAFFFGLVCASIVYILRQVSHWRWQEIIALCCGVLVAVGVTLIRPPSLPGEWWILMIAASVAICAMILPGISGMFILFLFGLHTVMYQAIAEFNWLLLGSFAVGAGVGLLLFSHLLSWLLHHYYNSTLAVLIGFLIGSLKLLWPWQHTIVSSVDRHGDTVPLVKELVSPYDYVSLVGQEPQIMFAVIAAVFGFVIVFILELSAEKSQ